MTTQGFAYLGMKHEGTTAGAKNSITRKMNIINQVTAFQIVSRTSVGRYYSLY